MATEITNVGDIREVIEGLRDEALVFIRLRAGQDDLDVEHAYINHENNHVVIYVDDPSDDCDDVDDPFDIEGEDMDRDC